MTKPKPLSELPRSHQAQPWKPEWEDLRCADVPREARVVAMCLACGLWRCNYHGGSHEHHEERQEPRIPRPRLEREA